jgi:hypothetical protein
MTGARRRLTGHIEVALPPAAAFRLFTPRGEQDWAHGWHPRFPAPAPDDTEPGTVFETSAHGQHTIWLVTSREAGKRICGPGRTPSPPCSAMPAPAPMLATATTAERPGTTVSPPRGQSRTPRGFTALGLLPN